MCIYLWMQSEVDNPEENLYDQNGKRISYDDTNRQNIVEKIFSVSKNGRKIVIDEDTAFKKNGNSFVFEFYTNVKDEHNRKLPALLYFTTSNYSLSNITSKIQNLCDNIVIELDCDFIKSSLITLKSNLNKRKIILYSSVFVSIIIISVFIRRICCE